MHVAISYDILATIAAVITWSAVLLSTVMGAVLAYHWYRFSRDPLYTAATIAFYGAGCTLFIAIMFSLGPTLLL